MDSNLTISPQLLMQEKTAEQLASSASGKGEKLTEARRKEIKKVSQDFEALFTGMMLKSMRETVPEDKLTGGGKAEETFRYMLDQEYAAAAAKRGGAKSIASMVEKELLKRYSSPVSPGTNGAKSEEL